MASLDPTKNFAIVTVSTGYDNDDTSIALSSGHGARLPAPATDGAFNLVWWNSTDYADPADDPNVEVIRVTARSTDTLTVTRGQEGTSGTNKNTGGKTYKMILAVTKKMVDDIAALVPTGTLLMWPTGSAPTGYLLCNGQLVSRTTYAALYTLIGDTYGAGDGSTTFALPDFRGRMAIGVGTGTQVITFAAGDVNTTTNEITVPSNQALFDGTEVVLSAPNGAPGGLADATTYYVNRVSATAIKLATSRDNARGTGTTGGGTPSTIDITSQGTGPFTLTITLTARALAEKGGEEWRYMSVMELVDHDHTTTAELETGSSGSGGTGGGQTPQGDVGRTGGGKQMNVMSPFLTINYVIKT